MSHFISTCDLCGRTFAPEDAVNLPTTEPGRFWPVKTVCLCPTCYDKGCPACTGELDDGTAVTIFGRDCLHQDCLDWAMTEAEAGRQNDEADYWLAVGKSSW